MFVYTFRFPYNHHTKKKRPTFSSHYILCVIKYIFDHVQKFNQGEKMQTINDPINAKYYTVEEVKHYMLVLFEISNEH